jgi:hypothetical protein
VRQVSILGTDHWRRAIPLLSALCVVGINLGGLLVGRGIVGGDPDREFRNFRFVRAEEFRQGRLPFWSDRLGLGVPLIAESQVAAFYPPNQVLDRALDPLTAYDLAAWLHLLFLTAAVYALARILGIMPWGAALAGVAFTLSGQLMGHFGHEPFYQAIPFLILILTFTEQYLASGRFLWLGLLALSFGVSLTIGHFQYQFYAVVGSLFLSVWRVWRDRYSWPRLAGIVGAIAWGGAIAAIQLLLTSELALLPNHRLGGDLRGLTMYNYPLGHWMEVVFPLLFDRTDAMFAIYMRYKFTNRAEACFYVGTIPLILAFSGLLARRDRTFAPWLVLGAAGIAVNVAVRYWTPLYFLLLRLPGFGLFRCPGRYMIYPTLTLCLLAGAGFDRGLGDRTFRRGTTTGGLILLLALAWALVFSFLPSKRPYFWNGHLVTALAWGGFAWAVGMTATMLWWRGRVGYWMPFAVVAVELGLLFHANLRESWGPHIHIPQGSTVLRRLQAEPRARRVAGELFNIPVRAGLIPATSYYSLYTQSQWLFESATRRSDAVQRQRLYRRYGVTHGIHPVTRPESERLGIIPLPDTTEVAGRQPLGVFEDQALSLASDRYVTTWVVTRYPGAFPPARIVRRWHVVDGPEEAMEGVARCDDPGEGWVVTKDYPADLEGPRASSARVLEWDGFSGTVEHDGPCDIVLDRAYYPGWFAKVGNRPEAAVFRADACLQGIHLEGSGRTPVSVFYRPTWLIPGAVLSAASLVALLLTLAGIALRLVSGRRIGPHHHIPIHDVQDEGRTPAETSVASSAAAD